MEEEDIIRLNIHRYRRMLQYENNERNRRAIQTILREFEVKLIAARATSSPNHTTA
jgi:hypothetical protein